MKHRILITAVAIVLFGIITSCNNGQQKTADTSAEKPAQTILNIPKDLRIYAPFDNYLQDSTGIASSRLKVYASINFSCPTCIDRIKDWKAIAMELDKKKIPVIVIGNTDDRFELIKYLCKTKAVVDFPYPFFLDKAGEFVAKNKVVSESKELNAVLTDQNNQIILSGDVLHSPEAKSLFLKKIAEN